MRKPWKLQAAKVAPSMALPILTKKRVYFLGLVIIILGLFLAVRQSDLVFIFVHSLINIFAGGRSGVKVDLFLIYLGLLLILTYWQGRQPADKRNLLVSMWALIGSLYALGLGLFLYFIHRYGLSIIDFVVTFNNAEISSTKLFHNHILKGVMGTVMDRFYPYALENIDAGGAFVHLIPSVYFWIAGFLLLATFCAIVWQFINRTALPSTKRATCFVFLYAIVSFSVLKNILDGGLLNSETPVALAGLLWLTASGRPALQRWGSGMILATYIVVAFVSYIFGIFNFSELTHLIYQFVTFALVVAVFIYIIERPRFDRQGWLLLVLAGLFVSVPVWNDLKIRQYRNTLIGEAGAIVGLYQTPSNQDFQLRETIGDLRIYDYKPKSSVKVETLLEEFKVLDNLRAVTVPWEDCFPRGTAESYSVDVISKQPLSKSLPSFQTVGMNKLDLIHERNGWFYYSSLVVLDQCAPRPLNVIQEAFREMGAETFFLVNIY